MISKRLFSPLLVCCTAIVAACGSDKTLTITDPTNITAKCDAVSTPDLVDGGFASSPNSCSGEMYAKYGDKGFEAVNGEIGKLALAAPTDKLGVTFQTKIAQATPERQQQFVGHLLSFLKAAYGSKTPYDGPTMVDSHKDLAITRAQYGYFISDVVVPALKTSGVSESDIMNCFAPAVLDTDFVKTVVTCK
jgi:hypothetical protein